MDELAASRARLTSDLALARRIQLSLLPRLPDHPGWRMAAACRAAREVGGDFYDAFDIPQRPGRLGLAVADVTGKGVGAALMMAFSRAVLRAATYNGAGPADALRRTNRVLASEVRTGLFLTAVALELPTDGGRLRWASAGHEPPYLMPAGSDEVSELDAAAPMIGLLADLPAEDRGVTLEPGDRLVLWTDGVTDARAPDGELFGDARFRDVLRRSAAEDGAAGIVRDVLDAIERWSHGSPPADDITLLVLERTAA